MSQKRRDSKGRILRNGESQRKDGRYAYKYIGLDGKSKFVYSWKLEKTDRLPQGKRDGLSLREKEKQIQRDLDDGIAISTNKITLSELFERHLKLKKTLRYRTRVSYNSTYNALKTSRVGSMRINKISKDDIKQWVIELYEQGKSYGTIKEAKSRVSAAFRMAVDDGLIRSNPADFQINTIIPNNTKRRKALTELEERNFLNFIKEHKTKYYNAIYILFNTGLRISEFSGLTIEDIDFEQCVINVDHQLLRKTSGEYFIESSKTINGIRKIPMSKDVAECFRNAINDRPYIDAEPVVDGRSGFIFLSREGSPTVAQTWEYRIDNACNKYNSLNKNHPIKVTPHICRHTFCSRMARMGMNPKALQYIMGHSDISITLNVYTHINYDEAKRDFDNTIGASKQSNNFTTPFTTFG